MVLKAFIAYNGQFDHPHPHIYLVIKVLIQFQSETETKIRSITLYNDQNMNNAKEKYVWNSP